MKLRRRPDEKSPGYVGDHADKLSRIPPLPHDEDERPRREDREYGQTIFTRPPVPLPHFLRGRQEAARRLDR
jgi:hypothetical protein